ncbi:MAG: hypothetical protein QM723_38755 [Myxococcaceae bacterium]
MSIKSAILLSAALCLGVMTSALAQTTGSSGSSTGTNDTGYDSARTGNGVSDSYGNTTDTKAIPTTDDVHGANTKNSTGTSSSDVNLDQGTTTGSGTYQSGKSTSTKTGRYGRTGTAGKHGGGSHDGGTSGKDGGM